MKKRLRLAALSLALLAGCSMPLGCAYVSVSRGEVSVRRLALLYPAEAGQVTVSSSASNEVWQITGYRSDGGASAAAAVTSAAVQAAVRAAAP